MSQQQRKAIAGMLRAAPFDPAGDLREQVRWWDALPYEHPEERSWR